MKSFFCDEFEEYETAVSMKSCVLSGVHYQLGVSLPDGPGGPSYRSDDRADPAMCPLRSCGGVQTPGRVSSRGVHRGLSSQVPETH